MAACRLLYLQCRFRSTNWKVHPGFSPPPASGPANDILLIDMRGTGFALTRNVVPICKPTASPSVGDIVTILGFGITSSAQAQGPIADKPLKKVKKISQTCFLWRLYKKMPSGHHIDARKIKCVHGTFFAPQSPMH